MLAPWFAVLVVVMSGCTVQTTARPRLDEVLDTEPWFPPPDECGDHRGHWAIINGAPLPTHVQLSPGQVGAIGRVGNCTATLVGPGLVLTAAHCVLDNAEICFRLGPGPDQCVRPRRVDSHPTLDLATLQINEEDVADLGLIPFVVTENVATANWLGRPVEAAGYGRREDGGQGELRFLATRVSEVGAIEWVTDGDGTRGLCNGDSGGPLLAVWQDGSVRLAGVLSLGDPGCVGRDRFVRTDIARSWLLARGALSSSGLGCEAVGPAGYCSGNRAVWCAGDSLRTELCSACGWASGIGYGCIEGEDPCQGLSSAGTCEGLVARWCEVGHVRERDCGVCNKECALVSGAGGAVCSGN